VTGAATVLACAFMAAAALLAFYQVVMRYGVGRPTAWSEPVLQMLIVWMVYLGLAATLRSGALVAVDLVWRVARGPAAAVLRGLIAAATLVLLAHMVWYGWDMAERAASNLNPTLGISMSWGFASVPVGAALAILAVVARLLDPEPAIVVD
jgi:TRAP-type C4-dicarboxylate transport system permease small subunit